MAPMFHAIPLPDQRQDDGYWNAQSPEDTPGSITSYYVPVGPCRRRYLCVYTQVLIE